MVLIWIMARLLLDELLDQPRDDPALVPADRPELLDFNVVARLELVLLVVGLVAGARANVLPVERVRAVRDHLDDHSLLHLGLHDSPDHLAAEAVPGLMRHASLRFGRARGRLLRHGCFASPFLDFFGASAFLAAPFFGRALASALGSLAFAAFGSRAGFGSLAAVERTIPSSDSRS